MQGSNLKIVTTVAVVLTLLAVNVSQSITMSQAQSVGATYCSDNHKHKNTDWRDGCNSGLADCRGDKPYNPGKHSSEFTHGYDAGWAHGGCSFP